MSSLTINSQLLDIPGAWEHNKSLRRLRSTIRTRGENRVIGGRKGRKARPTIGDEVLVDLELMVFGGNDADGNLHADEKSGLDENLAYLEDWVRGLADAETDTWWAQLTTPSGRQFTADVQLLNWQILNDDDLMVVVGYDLRIPEGDWTEVTP